MRTQPRMTADGAWVGAAVPRKEDPRLLSGRGSFVADIERPNLLHAAFVRSPLPAARIEHVDLSACRDLDGVVAAHDAADLGAVGLTAVLDRPEFRATTMPILASGQVRYAGEPVGMVAAEDAYLAEDAAEVATVHYAEREPVPMIEAALTRAGQPVHDEVPDNVFLDLRLDGDGDGGTSMDELLSTAPLVVRAEFGSARLAALPMEGRACLAEWNDRDDQLVMYVSTQVPHQVRTATAQSLGLPERQLRVVAPDVGGGFGLKCVVGREEVAVAALALRLRRPVRWVEDRQENLTASFHGHEQQYGGAAAFDTAGRLLGVDVDIRCDVGAYSAFPFTSGVEPLMAAAEFPGAYRVARYRARTRGVATNKAPTAPYRGVSRPQIVLVMERLMDKAARRLGLDPVEVRRRNLIDEFPYEGVTGITYDPGSYRESLDLAEQRLRAEGWYERRERDRSRGRLVGIGYACFNERTAYGTEAFAQRKMMITPGYDISRVSMDPSGTVLVTTGTCSHGQGHETTLAQVVADQLGLHVDAVKVRQGDTDITPHGWGTFASRSAAVGGGAVRAAATRLAGKLRQVAAHLLEAAPDDIELSADTVRVRGIPEAQLPLTEVARVTHFESQRLPEGTEAGLEASGSYDPPGPGTFSNATHAVVCEVDPGTGAVELLRYIVVEDCGVVINPQVVDGQVRGGVAQGIAAALYERLHYDESGQPVAASLMDYLAPTATEIPPIEVVHLETPCPSSETGAKGMGEGGTIGAPAAVANAVNDAVGPAGVDPANPETHELDTVPLRPELILDALEGRP